MSSSRTRPSCQEVWIQGPDDTHTQFINDAGVPTMGPTPIPITQKVAEWRAEIEKQDPAIQQKTTPLLGRVSGLNTTATDQAKKAKLGDEAAKTALPATQQQLGSAMTAVTTEIGAEPSTKPLVTPKPEDVAAPPQSVAPTQQTQQPQQVAPAQQPQQVAPTQQPQPPAPAQQPQAVAPTQQPPATAQSAEQATPTQQQQTAQPQPTAQQLSATQQPATKDPANPAAAVQDPAAEQVPLTYDTYAGHIRHKFAAQIADLDRMHKESIASGAAAKRAEQKFHLTLEDVSKLKKQYEDTKAELDDEKRKALEAQIAAQEAALPNAGMRMSQLLDKAKGLIASLQGAEPPVKDAKAQLEGIMQASMLLAAQIDPVASEAGRGVYVKIDTEENPALVVKARDSGLPGEQVARMAVSQRNWLRQLWRTEVMKDADAAEILFLRDLGKEGQRTGLTFEQVQAKQIAKLQTVDPETKQAALRPDFKLATATPAELDKKSRKNGTRSSKRRASTQSWTSRR